MASNPTDIFGNALAPINSSLGVLLPSDGSLGEAARSWLDSWGMRRDLTRTRELVDLETELIDSLTDRTTANHRLLQTTLKGAFDLVAMFDIQRSQHQVQMARLMLDMVLVEEQVQSARQRMQDRVDEANENRLRRRHQLQRDLMPPEQPRQVAVSSPRHPQWRELPERAESRSGSRSTTSDPEIAMKQRDRERQYAELDEIMTHEVELQRRLAALEHGLTEEFGEAHAKRVISEVRRRTGFDGGRDD